MADKEAKEPKKRIRKPGSAKKTQTVRERTETAPKDKPRRIRKTARKISLPLGKVRHVGKKEVNVPLPLPDNKAGRVLKKKVKFRIVPKFVREAFVEVKLVTWPDRRQTINLTLAVFIFAVVFATLVGGLDYVLGELFKKLFVKS